MRKTLRDVAGYLKEFMVPGTQEVYAINSLYSNVSDEESIRKGVLAFRAFLVRFYDLLCVKGDVYDKVKKATHGYENRTTLSGYYPFLYNLSNILKRIGYWGVLDADAQALVCGKNIFNNKLTVSKNLECLRFLTECGLVIDGIDLNDKKQDISKIIAIKITYPDDPIMLTGLKVMAVAEIDHGTLVNQDVFLRCDYRVLKKDETDVFNILQDTIKLLPSDIQDFVFKLNKRYLDKGLGCAVEVKGFFTYIKYSYKRKDLWGINLSLNNGYHINVKPTKTDEYTDIIMTFPSVLQELIAKGYGCGRKRDVGHCDGGCRGLTIPLDASVLEIQDDIITWLDQELACLQKK